MSKEMGLILFGLFVAILPHLGFPSSTKVVLFAVAGISISCIGFLMRGAAISQGSAAESRPPERAPKLEDPA